MAALTATSWAVTIDRDQIIGRDRVVQAQLNIATSASGTYVTGGIPGPVAGKFGFRSRLDYLNIIDGNATGGGGLTAGTHRVEYDKDNHTVKVFLSSTGDELANTATLSNGMALYVEAHGY